MDFNRDTYLSSIPYLVSKTITEYDISKANISILLAKGKISLEEYNTVLKMNRMERQIYMGIKQRDNEDIKQALKQGFVEYRKRFIEENNINEGNILSIKKDALYIIGAPVYNLVFDNYVRFVPKNIYSSYYKILNLEVYYLMDNVNDIEQIDVKGISDDKLILHQNHMIYFLCTLFDSIQSGTPEETLQMINIFSDNYKKRNLPIEYYREFNSDSCFRITAGGTQYLLESVSEENKSSLNISYNYQIIQHIYKIVSTIYFFSRK